MFYLCLLGLRRNIPLHFEVGEQKFVVGLSSQLLENFDSRHYFRNGLIHDKSYDHETSYTRSEAGLIYNEVKPEYPVAPPFYR